MTGPLIFPNHCRRSADVEETHFTQFTRNVILSQLDHGVKVLLVNCQDVAYIDSAGIGELVHCLNLVKHREAKLGFFGLPAQVSKIVNLTRTNEILPVFDTEKDALAGLT
ncbi:MAG: STAS domain-containing protein [Bacteroidota bacterium]